MTFGGDTFACEKKRRTELAKRLLDEAIDKVRKEYDILVAEGKLPEGQFDTFYAGYGLALLEQNT